MIAGVVVGQSIETLRRTLETYLESTLGYIPPVHTGSHLSLLHPGMSGSYREGDDTILDFGTIHPSVATSFGLPMDTLYFEADFSTILAHYQKRDVRFHAISRYQTIPRELNFLMDSHTPTGDIACIIDTIHPWIQDITVASVYEDVTKIGEGKKSVSFAFTLSNHEATISDEDALSVQILVIETMKEKGYNLRG